MMDNITWRRLMTDGETVELTETVTVMWFVRSTTTRHCNRETHEKRLKITTD